MKKKKMVTAVIPILFLTVFLAGCSQEIPTHDDKTKDKTTFALSVTEQKEKSSYEKELEKIAYGYQELYQQAKSEEKLKATETVETIMNCIGAMGYTVVDMENQVNMLHSDDMMNFIKRVENKEDGELILIRVGTEGDFQRFDFSSSKGNVNITESYVGWEEERPNVRSTQRYEAYTWKYTEEGYLFFEQYRMPGYDGASGHTAVRVQPLEEKCRQLNQKYILPVSYELNNMFLVDFSEADFGELDFYDVFDLFYAEVMRKPLPYTADADLSVGAVYGVQKEEFEKVVFSHLKIDSITLQGKTRFSAEKQEYEYRPRGLYDCESPSYPFPEVVKYEENEDGTITLTVHAVYPDNNTAKAYAHEVVVRPLEGGGCQYVSNRVIPDENNDVASWRTDRLTNEAWQKFYGGTR